MIGVLLAASWLAVLVWPLLEEAGRCALGRLLPSEPEEPFYLLPLRAAVVCLHRLKYTLGCAPQVQEPVLPAELSDQLVSAGEEALYLESHFVVVELAVAVADAGEVESGSM